MFLFTWQVLESLQDETQDGENVGLACTISFRNAGVSV